MSKDKDLRVYLDHILESIEFIQEDAHHISKETFLKSHTLQDAAIRRIIIIGEAAKKLDQEFKNDHPEIPWRKITGTRDILTHEYFDVDLEKTWDIIQNDLPALELNIKKILSSSPLQ